MNHAQPLTIPGLPEGSSILMLAAAGSDWFAATSNGLYHSSDGGKTWVDALSTTGITGELIVPALAISPSFHQDRTVFAGTAGGILRSTDGGKKWELSNILKPEPVISCLALSPAYTQDGQLFGGSVEDGVLHSTDRGASFYTWNFQLVDLSILSLAVSPNFQSDHTLYAGTSTGLFGSHISGRAWRDIALPCGYAPVMSLAALGDGILLAGTEQDGLFRSTDSGQSWLRVGADSFNGAAALIENPGGQIIANAGDGLWISSDTGLTWQDYGLRLPKGVEISALAALDSGWLAGFSDGTLQVLG